MPARAFAFSKSEKLTKKRDIDAVFAEKRAYSCRGMKLLIRRNGTSGLRIVFIPVRNYPDSVRRNRARRLASESFRLIKGDCDQGFDLVIILYPGTDSFEERSRQLTRLLKDAGIFHGEACKTP
jgi:ribonuclease P protein component